MKVLSIVFLCVLGAKAGPLIPSCTVNAQSGSCGVGSISVSSTVFNPGQTATATGSYAGLVLIDADSGTIFGDYLIGGFSYFSAGDAQEWLCPSITIGQGTSTFVLQAVFPTFSPAPGQCGGPSPILGPPFTPSPIALPFTYASGIPAEITASVDATSGPLPACGCVGDAIASGNAFVSLVGFADSNGDALNFQVLPEPVMWPVLILALALILATGTPRACPPWVCRRPENNPRAPHYS